MAGQALATVIWRYAAGQSWVDSTSGPPRSKQNTVTQGHDYGAATAIATHTPAVAVGALQRHIAAYASSGTSSPGCARRPAAIEDRQLPNDRPATSLAVL